MDPQAPESTTCEVVVTLPSNTPVVGSEIRPSVSVKGQGSSKAPPHSLVFNWYRELNTCSCSVHHEKLAKVQCMSCVKLNVPLKYSYHCSTSCFSEEWENHLALHQQAAGIMNKNLAGNEKSVPRLRSSGSWPTFAYDSLIDENAMEVERDGKMWIKLVSWNFYMPTMADLGFSLRLESAAVDRSGGPYLSSIYSIVTDPVIFPPHPCPRRMIPIQWLNNDWNSNLQSPCELAFSVLSYNILSDLYATREKYSYCPTWALVWEYRRQNLLQEILRYDADILCLQEVQSDHFENFFKPELTNRGYSVTFKKKTSAVYTANQYVIDGCATFYRKDLFKEIWIYELEFKNPAQIMVEALGPELKTEGTRRLVKGNVALFVVLEKLHNCSTSDALQSRICVANTHIHADPSADDVKLFQVSKLVNVLEQIAKWQIPLLLCGDFNSLPASDPHLFIVRRNINPISDKETDPLGVYQRLKLHHSLPLVSAYASFSYTKNTKELRKTNPITKEPLFTNYTRDFYGTLDYIFYTEDSLRVEGLLELLDQTTIEIGLPSPVWSSDHIALMANFRLKPPSPERPSPPSLRLNP